MIISSPPAQKGNKCTVENSSWRVTIEHLDVMNGSINDLFDVTRCACLGVGFSANVIDEFLDSQTEIEE